MASKKEAENHCGQKLKLFQQLSEMHQMFENLQEALKVDVQQPKEAAMMERKKATVQKHERGSETAIEKHVAWR